MQIENNHFQQDILSFTKEEYFSTKNEYRNFYNNIIDGYGLDPWNLCESWYKLYSINNKCNLNEYSLRNYCVPVYIAKNILDKQFINNNEKPKVLEVGSYVTGLFPAMYYSHLGYSAEVVDIVDLNNIAPDICKIAINDFGVKIYQGYWSKFSKEMHNYFDLIYTYKLLFDDSSLLDVEKTTYRILKDDGTYFNVNPGCSFDTGCLTFHDYLVEIDPRYTFFEDYVGVSRKEDHNVNVETGFFSKRDRTIPFEKLVYEE